ncbi:MAG TPA: hypothetical protein VHM91_16810, partial [Verrucomicrobiales bacterium]|nr:hypothetical protein [Verrucomicrobiales bacterium]
MARRLRNTQTAIAHWRQWRDGGLRKADSLALPGRLLKAALWHELHELLTGFAYPLFKIRAGRLPELILDYEAALDRWAGPEFPGAASKWRCLDALRDWRNFVVDYRLALTHAWIDPAVLAWNRADHGPVVEAARLNLEAQPSTLRLFLNHRPPLS